MPLLLWLDSFEGATRCRLVANVCRARAEAEGENWTVECDRAVDLVTATMVQSMDSGVAPGIQGDMAT